MKVDLRGSLRIASMVFLLLEFIVSDYSYPYFSDNKDNDLNAGKGITSLHEFISLTRNIILNFPYRRPLLFSLMSF